MEDLVSTQPQMETAADYEAAIEQCLAEMKRLNEQMQKDQEEIDQLKADTRAMLAQLKAA